MKPRRYQMTSTLLTALFLTLFSQMAWAGNWNLSPTNQPISYQKPTIKFGGFYAYAKIPSMGGIKGVETIDENGEKILRFSLIDGMKGGSSIDHLERHGAPYWERAELRNDYLSTGKRYRLQYQARFVQGFDKQDETITQIHQHTKSCGLMTNETMWHTGKKKIGTTPIRKFAVVNKRWHGVNIEKEYGKWHDITIEVETVKNIYRLFVNKKLQTETPFTLFKCGKPFFKIGIYRPGSWDWERKAYPDEKYHSIVDFKNISISNF
jgi:hypothetical protein